MLRVVGDAESAAEVDALQRPASRRNAGGQVQRVAPLLQQHLGLQHLRGGELVHALEAQPGMALHGRDRVVEHLLVETEGRRLAAHAHRTARGRLTRVDAQRDRLLAAQFGRQRAAGLDLLERLQVDLADAAGDRGAQLVEALAGAGEQHVSRVGARREREPELARRDLQAGAELDQAACDLRVRIGLDRSLGQCRGRTDCLGKC